MVMDIDKVAIILVHHMHHMYLVHLSTTSFWDVLDGTFKTCSTIIWYMYMKIK